MYNSMRDYNTKFYQIVFYKKTIFEKNYKVKRQHFVTKKFRRSLLTNEISD